MLLTLILFSMLLGPGGLPVLTLILVFAIAVSMINYDEHKRSGQGGYPIGNFGICAQVNGTGEFLPSIYINPSREGPWLEHIPGGKLEVRCGDVSLATNEFAFISSQRGFPFAKLELSDPRLPGIELKVTSFSPVAESDAFTTSLPIILAEIEISNSSKDPRSTALSYTMHEKTDIGTGKDVLIGKFRLTVGDRIAFGFEDGNCNDGARVSVDLAPGGKYVSRFILAYFDEEGFYTERLPSMGDLVDFASKQWDALKAKTGRFSSLIPSVGDEQLDQHMRWYLSAGVFLTRLTKHIAITMGYCELNQRDSYWTSMLHLVMWPDLEKRMLQETAHHMRPNGKIPTTILPTIEREDDLDINCYFVMRVKRYLDFTRDRKLLEELWPSVKRAMDWLETRDVDGDGLLEQGSYWGDWKDVEGVEGRKHAPHFEFVWLGALQSCEEMALIMGDTDARGHYEHVFSKAHNTLSKHVSDGGLWNGEYYTTRWYDGRKDHHVQQDQLVGAAIGLIPADRLASIYQAMTPGDCAWGMRETYPYRKNFSHGPGEYHNGGVWPFLCFMDALGRYRNGYPIEAESLMRRVGKWDLEEFGDYTPHEYLMGSTGENRGPTIQGWNADYFTAVVCGAFGLEVVDKDLIQIAPRIPQDRSYRSALRLSQGVIWLEQIPGPTRPIYTITSEAGIDLKIRFGRWSEDKPIESRAVRLGTGWLSWTQVTLPAHKTIKLT